MPDFTKGETKFLEGCVDSFTESFRAGVADVLAAQFRGAQPAEVVELREQLSILKQQLSMKAKPSRVHDTLTPLLKRIVIDERRRAAEAIDPPMRGPSTRSWSPPAARGAPVEEMMGTPGSRSPRPARPRLTDYLSSASPRRWPPPSLSGHASTTRSSTSSRRRPCSCPTSPTTAPGGLPRREIAVVYLDIDAFKE